MTDARGLPPGQIEIQDFPRFGWGAFAFRFPTNPADLEITIEGDVGESLVVRYPFGEPRS